MRLKETRRIGVHFGLSMMAAKSTSNSRRVSTKVKRRPYLWSSIAPALIESCPSRIFLPNARASEPQQLEAYRRFGLNDTQVQLIAHATPKRDYYFQSRAGNRVFDLGLGPIALSICGASSVADIDAASRIHDNPVFPDFANEWLVRRELEWAADILATHTELSTSNTGAA